MRYIEADRREIMNDKKINSLIIQITSRVIKLNSISKDDYLLIFSGHVDEIEVSCMEGGFSRDRSYDRKSLIDVYISWTDAEEKLTEGLKVLDDLIKKENKKKNL